MGDNHSIRTLNENPFPFGVVAPTGDNETSFLAMIDVIMMLGDIRYNEK